MIQLEFSTVTTRNLDYLVNSREYYSIRLDYRRITKLTKTDSATPGITVTVYSHWTRVLFFYSNSIPFGKTKTIEDQITFFVFEITMFFQVPKT